MSFNKHIDYTNLKNIPSKEIQKFVETANHENFYGVCVLPSAVNLVRRSLNSSIRIISVAGFPPPSVYRNVPKNPLFLGFYDVGEIGRLRQTYDMVDELDIVLPMFWFTYNKKDRVKRFLSAIKSCYPEKPLKVIIELGTLFQKEEVLLEILKLLETCGVDFVKTNTGLISQDTGQLILQTTKMLRLIKENQITLQVKASGGIRTREQAQFLLDLGVARVGASANLSIGSKITLSKEETHE